MCAFVLEFASGIEWSEAGWAVGLVLSYTHIQMYNFGVDLENQIKYFYLYINCPSKVPAC